MKDRSPAVQARAELQPPPVEYAVAVECFLAGASLGHASRRVYRISLTSWAWALAGLPPPRGTLRRGAAPPVLPLALLDDQGTAGRLRAALTERICSADQRTVSRELSALRSAIDWWRDQGWIRTDPASGLRGSAGHAPALAPLTASQVDQLFRSGAGLREQAFWRVLYDTGARAEDVLALDAGRVDLAADRGLAFRPPAIPGGGEASWLCWQHETTELLSWLLAGRPAGPVFLTGRRARAGTTGPDICPITRRARMSYRRAAEIFIARTRPLDPSGRGWTLHQLQLAR
ncbi:MAG TPA: site-specific recombinase [Streptosporangiaceae bacterium]|jgi:integrase/recombinase XerD